MTSMHDLPLAQETLRLAQGLTTILTTVEEKYRISGTSNIRRMFVEMVFAGYVLACPYIFPLKLPGYCITVYSMYTRQ